MGTAKRCPVRGLVVVLVKIGNSRVADEYYICTWDQLRNLLVAGHRSYLKQHGGIRPSNPESMHSAIQEEALKPYRDGWEAIQRNLG